MAYDNFLADSIRLVFREKSIPFAEKKMFGGLAFMVNDKMCCGLLFDKKKKTDLLMARVGSEMAQEVLHQKGCHPMDFSGRPMKNFVFITPDGFDEQKDLEYWIQLCLDFNPKAKSARKK